MAITLSSLIANTGSITTPNGDLKVRGLTIRDIGFLAKKYSETLAVLVDKDASDIDWKSILLDTPEFCHEIIARVCKTGVSEKDSVEVASKIPAGIQISILVEAWNQTAIDPELINTAVKKFLDLLTGVNNLIGSKQ